MTEMPVETSLFEDAVSYKGPYQVRHFTEHLAENKKHGVAARAFRCGFDAFDAKIGGIETGEVVVISGKTKNGKTLFAESWLHSMMQKDPSASALILSYEIQTVKLLMKYEGRPELPIYVPDQLETMNFEWLKERCLEAKLKYGCKIVLIDHLHFMVDMDTRQNMSLNIGAFMRKLKHEIAKGMDMAVVLIAHQGQTKKDSDASVDGIRDCLPAGELVYCDGKRVDISKVKPKMPVVSRASTRSLQNDVVSASWEAGEKEILEITTKRGRKIRCSKGHRFYAMTHKGGAFGPGMGRGIRGWTRAENLLVGQKIAAVRRYPDIQNPQKELNETQAAFLGWLVGDGHINRKFYCEITVNTEDEIQTLRELAGSWGCSLTVTPYKKAKAFRCYVATKRGFLRRYLKKYKFREIGNKKRVPDAIFRHKTSVVAAFLRGLFHADGSSNLAGHKDNPMLVVTLATISERLASEVQHLLLRLGILSTKRWQKYMNPYTEKMTGIWNIVITGTDCLEFHEQVGFYSAKQSRMEGQISKWKPKDTRRRKNQDIVYERIKSIVPAGAMPTYDISVRGHHQSLKNNSFCVSDFLVHNSSFVGQECDSVIIVSRQKNPEDLVDYWDKLTNKIGPEKATAIREKIQEKIDKGDPDDKYSAGLATVSIDRARRSGTYEYKKSFQKRGEFLEEL